MVSIFDAMKHRLLIFLFIHCTVFSAFSQVKNTLTNFPFEKGSVKVITYGSIIPDTLVFKNLKEKDSIHFEVEPKGNEQYVFFAIVASSSIGEYSSSFYSVQNKSDNHFRFKKGSAQLLKTNSDYNIHYYEFVRKMDSLFSIDMSKAIHSFETYKGQDVYFYFNLVTMLGMKEPLFSHLDSIYQLAASSKPSYWKNLFMESYLTLKNINAGIFNNTDMQLLDRTSNPQNLLDHLDSTKQNTVYVWASWCAPCIEKLRNITPKMDSINKHTNLILVSIDEDNAKWQKACERFNFTPKHFLTKNNGAFTKKLLINTVPHSININSKTLKIKRSDF